MELKSYTTASSARKAATKAATKTSDVFFLTDVTTFKTEQNGETRHFGRLVVDQLSITSADAEAVAGFDVVDMAGNPITVADREADDEPEIMVEQPAPADETPEGEEVDQPEVDPKAATKAAIKANRYEWFAKHGLITEEQAEAAKAKAELPTIGRVAKNARYTYLGVAGDGEGNHRSKVGGDGYNMVEWLKAHPGATRAEMAKAGFPAVHIRWDLLHNPQLFQVAFPAADSDDETGPQDEVEQAEQAEVEQTIEAVETHEQVEEETEV